MWPVKRLIVFDITRHKMCVYRSPTQLNLEISTLCILRWHNQLSVLAYSLNSHTKTILFIFLSFSTWTAYNIRCVLFLFLFHFSYVTYTLLQINVSMPSFSAFYSLGLWQFIRWILILNVNIYSEPMSIRQMIKWKKKKYIHNICVYFCAHTTQFPIYGAIFLWMK